MPFDGSKNKLSAFGLALSVFVFPSLAAAADGKALYEDKGCTACHGEDAKTPLEKGYPKLAGQNADYMLQQLKDVKSGARKNGQIVDTMKPVIDELKDDEMKALTSYLASLKWDSQGAPPAKTLPGKALYLTKTCIACHGKEGMKPLMKTYPFLAGQDKTYLLTQMKDIGSKARANGLADSMQPVMHLVNDKEKAQIAEYLSLVK
ncbi:MAG: cytochrome c4 [Rhodospirillales bacterium]|nr:cytochrome c4 [Rhodospirillales bacterium]